MNAVQRSRGSVPTAHLAFHDEKSANVSVSGQSEYVLVSFMPMCVCLSVWVFVCSVSLFVFASM